MAEYLLPNGKRVGGEWKAGDVAARKAGPVVRLAGPKRGVWRDFAAGPGGDMLDLWAACRAASIGQAMTEAKAYLGIRDTMPVRERKDTGAHRSQRAWCPRPAHASGCWAAG